MWYYRAMSAESSLPKGDPDKVKKVEGPTILTNRGFETPVSLSVGDEEDIFALLRAKGWSEASIAAFKSGKIIERRVMKLKVDRDLILGESWEGKKDDGGH